MLRKQFRQTLTKFLETARSSRTQTVDKACAVVPWGVTGGVWIELWLVNRGCLARQEHQVVVFQNLPVIKVLVTAVLTQHADAQ